jgi:hypothetical protein
MRARNVQNLPVATQSNKAVYELYIKRPDGNYHLLTLKSILSVRFFVANVAAPLFMHPRGFRNCFGSFLQMKIRILARDMPFPLTFRELLLSEDEKHESCHGCFHSKRSISSLSTLFQCERQVSSTSIVCQ